jgi:hypothetical protein
MKLIRLHPFKDATLELNSHELEIILCSLAVATEYKICDGYSLPNIWKDKANKMVTKIEEQFTIRDGFIK